MLRLSDIEIEDTITQYWLAYYSDTEYCLCTLCGNTGKVDTRGRAISEAGVDVGCVNFCLCPNGQHERRQTNG